LAVDVENSSTHARECDCKNTSMVSPSDRDYRVHACEAVDFPQDSEAETKRIDNSSRRVALPCDNEGSEASLALSFRRAIPVGGPSLVSMGSHGCRVRNSCSSSVHVRVCLAFSASAPARYRAPFRVIISGQPVSSRADGTLLTCNSESTVFCDFLFYYSVCQSTRDKKNVPKQIK